MSICQALSNSRGAAAPRLNRPGTDEDVRVGVASRLRAPDRLGGKASRCRRDPTRVSVAGATGWTGRPIAEAILAADDLQLVSAVARSTAGMDLGEAWKGDPNGVPVHADVSEALDNVDVLVDYPSQPRSATTSELRSNGASRSWSARRD